MKKSLLSFVLAMALCLGLSAGFSVPAAALESSATDYGKNNLVWINNHAYVVNDHNELWKFTFPYTPSNAYLAADPIILVEKEVASNKKIADSIIEIVAGAGGFFVLKTNGSLAYYNHAKDDFTDFAISNVSTLITGEQVGSLGCLYINDKRELMGINCTVVITATGDYLSAGTPVVVDSSVLDGAGQYYIKSDASLWKWSKSGATGYTKEKYLDDISVIVTGHSHFAITEDGTLWAWGFSETGQTGVSPDDPAYKLTDMFMGNSYLGKYHLVTEPVKVMDGIAQIIPDYGSTHAITIDGRVLTWGGKDPLADPNTLVPQQKAENQWMKSSSFVSVGAFGGPTLTISSVPYKVAQSNEGKLVLHQFAANDYYVPPINGSYANGQNNDAGYTFVAGNYIEHTFTVDMTMRRSTKSTAPYAPDTPSSWAVESVNSAIAAGLVPDALQSKYTTATTRAEFCALAVALYETATGKAITKRAQFSDTTDVNVQKMAGLGVVNGVGDNKFAPSQKLTREQAATMLSRLADAIGKPLTAQAPTFADNASVSSWAVDAVGQMQATGIMGGVGNNTFAPKSDYTREQSIITIMRLFDIVK